MSALAALALSTGSSANAAITGRPATPHVAAEVPVTATDLVARRANNSPALASDPTNPRFVVLANRLDGPDFGCALHVSGDGGRSWLPARPVPRLPTGAEKCYAPEVAFDREGVLHYLFVGLAGGGNAPVGAYLTTSADRGRSFSRPRRVLGPERYQVRMVLDPDVGRRGRIHLVWLEAGSDPPLGGLPPSPNPILAAYSDDGGRTFSRPVPVSDAGRPRAVAPAIALGPRHSLAVVYYDLGDDARDYQGLEGPRWEGTWSLVAATSTDGGRSFGRGSVVDGAIVPPERVMLIYTMAPPSVVVDRSGAVYAAWHDARHGDWDAFLRRSGDGGRRWGPLRRLNDDPVGDGRHQYLPRLAVAPDGRLDAVFYDRRRNAENRGNDVYYTFSTDGGAHFAANVRLTSRFFDSRNGPRYAVPSAQGLFEFGSRLGLVSLPSGALAAWTDTRNTFRARGAQDIFATEVDLPPGRTDGRAWPVAPAAVGLAGAAAVLVARRRRSGRGDPAVGSDGAAGDGAAE